MANGIITKDTLKDVYFQRTTIAEIFVEASKLGNLAHPSITKTIQIPGIKGKIPLMNNVNVEEDLDEFEQTAIQTAEWGSVDFDMKKDRLVLGISDEAQMEKTATASFETQRNAGTVALNSALDRKIATALATTPQTATWDVSETNLMASALADAVGYISPNRISGVAVNGKTYTKIIGLLASNGGLKSGMSGFNVDGTLSGALIGVPQATIVMSENLTDDKLYVVSNEVPGVIIANGGYKARSWDDQKSGAQILQYDIWRAVKSNIRQTSGNLNKGVVEITLA